MKIVVFGGTGLIGKQVVRLLREGGHEAVPASPSLGVNTLTGEGLTEVLAGAQVSVDVTNSPSFEPAAVLDFFDRSTRNILAAGAEAGVGHHVALSIVGLERVPDSGYCRAKLAQEALIRSSSIPHSILRATQFFEFGPAIGLACTADGTVRLPVAQIQPVAAADVAAALADLAAGPPRNAIVELAGPEAFPMADFVRRSLAAAGDPRPVVADPSGLYFGAPLHGREIVPAGESLLGPTHFADWLSRPSS
jgi:uncharacterized protein YbjT (DUF2867 family)